MSILLNTPYLGGLMPRHTYLTNEKRLFLKKQRRADLLPIKSSQLKLQGPPFSAIFVSSQEHALLISYCTLKWESRSTSHIVDSFRYVTSPLHNNHRFLLKRYNFDGKFDYWTVWASARLNCAGKSEILYPFVSLNTPYCASCCSCSIFRFKKYCYCVAKKQSWLLFLELKLATTIHIPISPDLLCLCSIVDWKCLLWLQSIDSLKSWGKLISVLNS